jgi:pSer/pThr/pTyr-binding forkhead associated (FHA) protein
MRLVIKKGEDIVNEFQFGKGPIKIGRNPDSQLFLSDISVSRHHAVIYNTQDGKWVLEDLDSINKTHLNDQPIHKSELKSGDIIRISDFVIEVSLGDDTIVNSAINLEDTLTKTVFNLQSPVKSAAPDWDSKSDALRAKIIRKPDADHGTEIRLPAKRLKDFLIATEKICKCNTLDDILLALVSVISKQLNPYECWCALRSQPNGPMMSHAGKHRDGSKVELNDIKLSEKITDVIEKKHFVLYPRIQQMKEKEIVRSAMITPILCPNGCFGVIYLANDASHEYFNLSDLDYLSLICAHTAVVIENF